MHFSVCWLGRSALDFLRTRVLSRRSCRQRNVSRFQVIFFFLRSDFLCFLTDLPGQSCSSACRFQTFFSACLSAVSLCSQTSLSLWREVKTECEAVSLEMLSSQCFNSSVGNLCRIILIRYTETFCVSIGLCVVCPEAIFFLLACIECAAVCTVLDTGRYWLVAALLSTEQCCSCWPAGQYSITFWPSVIPGGAVLLKGREVAAVLCCTF